MGYFAKIVESVVTEIIVAEQDYIDTLPGEWVETDLDGATKGNYAGIGYTYHERFNLFVPPKRFPSWILDRDTGKWKAPKKEPKVKDGYAEWDEEKQEWIEKKWGSA